MSDSISLEEMTWPEVGEAIAGGRTTVVIAVGAIEQHGPHLPLACDRLIGDGARDAVVLAEAEVPKAMAEAFRKGNFGVMDYYNMKNVISDTKMRSSIANEDSNDES